MGAHSHWARSGRSIFLAIRRSGRFRCVPQSYTAEKDRRGFRGSLTMALVEAPLASHDAFKGHVTIETTEAAIWGGRYAAEQVLIHYLPALIADGVACSALLFMVRPLSPLIGLGVGVAGAAAIAAAAMRRIVFRVADVAWAKSTLVVHTTRLRRGPQLSSWRAGTSRRTSIAYESRSTTGRGARLGLTGASKHSNDSPR